MSRRIIELKTKEEILKSFDPNGIGEQGKLFGLPFDSEHAEVIVIPVPWEVTVSYNAGTVDGPMAILEASSQVDLFVKGIRNAWEMGIALADFPNEIIDENIKYRDLATSYIKALESGKSIEGNPELSVIPKTINEVSEKLNIYVKSEANKYLRKRKLVGLIGGDHSTPLGLIRALNEKYTDFGILQIDAHADLRKAYEGFKYSHASIMYNALFCENLSKLVQVGVRDCCEEEIEVIKNSNGRIVTFFDEEIKEAAYHGTTWKKMSETIVNHLPSLVYISFDIDGLDPKYCPNTGTPVPGGLDFQEAIYLIKTIVASGRKIIGFDINEVAPGRDEWDGNVGARILYAICNWMGVSQSKLKLS